MIINYNIILNVLNKVLKIIDSNKSVFTIDHSDGDILFYLNVEVIRDDVLSFKHFSNLLWEHDIYKTDGYIVTAYATLSSDEDYIPEIDLYIGLNDSYDIDKLKSYLVEVISHEMAHLFQDGINNTFPFNVIEDLDLQLKYDSVYSYVIRDIESYANVFGFYIKSIYNESDIFNEMNEYLNKMVKYKYLTEDESDKILNKWKNIYNNIKNEIIIEK